MKHHFADFLDRSGGHWSIIPNRDRYKYRCPDVALAPKSATILTLTKEDANWTEAAKLPWLEELTLHEARPDQLEFVSMLWRLKRLRITHARPKSLEFLARLDNLEELVLEYVSGFEDLSPVGNLPNLRALHLENLRRVQDFSGLRHAKMLRYLSIGGTVDWDQPVADFGFLGDLTRLEFLFLRGIRSFAEPPALLPLLGAKSLVKLWIPGTTFPLEEYALVEAAMPNVEGAVFAPFQRVAYQQLELDRDDIRTKMPEDTLRSQCPEVTIDWQGRRWVPDPTQEWFTFLGKRAGRVSCRNPKAAERCAAHENRYRVMVDAARKTLHETPRS